MKRIDIDSHTEGEPTRVVIGGGPDLGERDAVTRRDVFRREHDGFRSAVVRERVGFGRHPGSRPWRRFASASSWGYARGADRSSHAGG